MGEKWEINWRDNSSYYLGSIYCVSDVTDTVSDIHTHTELGISTSTLYEDTEGQEIK